MLITVIGAGYVGLVSAACFAEMGNSVTCVDSNAEKIDGLKAGKISVHEPGLDELVLRNIKENRLAFATSVQEAAPRSGIFFIAVSTPPAEDGSANVTQVLNIAAQLGTVIRGYSIVVSKSTVPLGTADRIRVIIQNEIAKRGESVEFDVVSNPEFLKEGAAIKDFMHPDRIVLGSQSGKALEVMRRLYAPFTRNHDRILTMGPREAEMTKYASNAMLATKISFMNEIAGLCEKFNVDVEYVRKGIGADSRIGYAFIYPGCGYGGSCLPKDLRALLYMGKGMGLDFSILKAVEKRNALQKRRLFDKIIARFGETLSGRTFSVWGLSFKPETDDVREAPSLSLLELLFNAGAKVRAFDPVSEENVRRVVDHSWLQHGLLTFAPDQYEALDRADALVLVTEWKQFRNPDFQRIKERLALPVVFDGRNQYDPEEMSALGFEYYGIGRGAHLPAV